MSQPSTASVSVTSLRDLSGRQMGLISTKGPEPGNRGAVEKFTKQFCKEFGVKVPWKIMRRLITQIRRRERRNGWGDTTPRTSPPYVRFSSSTSSAMTHPAVY